MSATDRPRLNDVDVAVRDAEDVFLIAEAVLNAEPAALSPMLRDALSSVLRLGRERAAEARHGVTRAMGRGR